MSSLALELLRTREVSAADGSRVPLTSEVSEAEGLFLQRLVERAKPAQSLEVGLAFGISALFLCDALRRVGARRHIVIDPFQTSRYRDIGLENLKRAGLFELVDFRGGSSDLELPGLLASGQKIDFAFIDGSHHFDRAFVDFFFVDRMLEEGGIAVFDDANWPALRKLVRFALTNRPYAVLDSLPKRLGARKLAARYGSFAALRELWLDRRLGVPIPHSRCVALVKLSSAGDPLGNERLAYRDF